jgi:hypothetical protein
MFSRGHTCINPDRGMGVESGGDTTWERDREGDQQRPEKVGILVQDTKG